MELQVVGRDDGLLFEIAAGQGGHGDGHVLHDLCLAARGDDNFLEAGIGGLRCG